MKYTLEVESWDGPLHAGLNYYSETANGGETAAEAAQTARLFAYLRLERREHVAVIRRDQQGRGRLVYPRTIPR